VWARAHTPSLSDIARMFRMVESYSLFLTLSLRLLGGLLTAMVVGRVTGRRAGVRGEEGAEETVWWMLT
jgi:hypothetical protein